jgi:hypothetical protein
VETPSLAAAAPVISQIASASGNTRFVMASIPYGQIAFVRSEPLTRNEPGMPGVTPPNMMFTH